MSRVKSWGVIGVVTIASTAALWMAAGMQTIKQNFDGPYYAVVAKSWYDRDIIRRNFSFPLPLEYYAAHFPMYPLLISAFAKIGYLNGAVIINLVATMAVGIVLYEIVREFKWGNPLVLALVWLFWWPRIWIVRSIASPETLFILWMLLSLYFFQKKKFWWAGITGAAAVLTKSPGILLPIAYGLWLIANYVKTKKITWQAWPVLLIPMALVGVFGLFYVRTGDFWAYFHSGDNIHLQLLPFRVFDSSQPWVGNFWLEDVLWIYLVGAVGVWRMFRKSAVWGWFGAVFYTTILFVSHRDISRYALPLAPIIWVGTAEILEKKEIKWALIVLTIPAFLYSWNFLVHNTAAISAWAPFFSS